jgi:integrase/recombinase XerD
VTAIRLAHGALTTETADERARLSQLTAAWLGTYADATQRAYFRDLGDWLAWCGQRGVSPLAARMAHVDAWIASQRKPDLDARPASEATIARRVSAISSWYRHLQRSTRHDEVPLAAVNPATTDDRPQLDRDFSPTVELNDAETERLVAAADADGHRSSALIRLMVLTGLRCSSVISARIEDISDRADGPVLIARASAGKLVTVPLPPAVATPINAMLAARGSPATGSLFATRSGRPVSEPYIFRLVRRLAAAANIESAGGLSPHSLRRTFAVNALAAGVSLRDLQDAMGHTTPQTTRRYDGARAAAARHPVWLIADRLPGLADAR